MKKSGFTLLELLVALGVFSAIMAVLMNVFFQFKDQTARFESVMALRQESRILEHLLRQDLQAAVYLNEFVKPNIRGEVENESGIISVNETDGDLDADQLHMHVNRRSRFYRGLSPDRDPEIHEVSYFLKINSKGIKQLLRREQFYIDNDLTDGEPSITHAISDNVIGFDVKFFLSKRTEPLDEWGTDRIKSMFKEAVGIPAGVLVTLKLKNAAGERLESGFQVNLHPDMGGGISWK